MYLPFAGTAAQRISRPVRDSFTATRVQHPDRPEVEVTVPALTRLVGGERIAIRLQAGARAELSDRGLPDLTRTLVAPEDGMGVAGAVATARTAGPRLATPLIS
jgi:hypothetical protein